MHLEVLSKKQAAFLPFLSVYKEEFGLTGGTAIALHVGHRQSIDFDLFSVKPFRTYLINSSGCNFGFSAATVSGFAKSLVNVALATPPKLFTCLPCLARKP